MKIKAKIPRNKKIAVVGWVIKTIEERIIINMPLFKLKFNRSLLIKDRIKNVRDIANVDG